VVIHRIIHGCVAIVPLSVRVCVSIVVDVAV
jgi:hypothetical protein